MKPETAKFIDAYVATLKRASQKPDGMFTSAEWSAMLAAEGKPYGEKVIRRMLAAVDGAGRLMVSRRRELNRCGQTTWKWVYGIKPEAKA